MAGGVKFCRVRTIRSGRWAKLGDFEVGTFPLI
jgi:hypothetical protein